MKVENYSNLKIYVLEEILGNRTPSELSQILGFKFDKVKRWMNNEKILKWDDFVSLCGPLKINLPSALEILHFRGDYPVTSFFSYLKEYCAFKTNQDVSNYLNCHVSVVKRYSTGNTIPDLETIFRLINYNSNILPLFLNRLFTDKISTPRLSNWISTRAKDVYFETKLPLSAMIKAALCIEEYKTRIQTTDEWLAELLNFGINEIQDALKSMIDSKILIIERKDTYRLTHETINLDGVSVQEIIPFIQFLNLKLVDLLEKRKKTGPAVNSAPGAMIYRVFPASLESITKINSILLRTNSEILKILEEDTHPKLEARALLLQTFKLTK